jgi:hypothetical protein
MKHSRSIKRCYFIVVIVFSAVALAGATGLWAQAPQPAAGQPAAAEQKPAEAKPKLVGSDLGLPARLGQEIAKAPEGKGKGQIDPSAPRGVFGVPGAPQPSTILIFLWATWVGWVFSTVGAFGGILAGVGHMTVYGLGDSSAPSGTPHRASTRP